MLILLEFEVSCQIAMYIHCYVFLLINYVELALLQCKKFLWAYSLPKNHKFSDFFLIFVIFRWVKINDKKRQLKIFWCYPKTLTCKSSSYIRETLHARIRWLKLFLTLWLFFIIFGNFFTLFVASQIRGKFFKKTLSFRVAGTVSKLSVD